MRRGMWIGMLLAGLCGGAFGVVAHFGFGMRDGILLTLMCGLAGGAVAEVEGALHRRRARRNT